MSRSATPSPASATSRVPVERAILSVSDKSGLAEFARELRTLGVELYSTGGTRRFLLDHAIEAVEVADYTGFPEMMEGRVKTLHPRIFGGILCRRDRPDDLRAAADQGIVNLDLVVVNLYPFAETIARPDTTREMAIENIDIGGPSLVRAAAKNSRFVAIATSPDQYAQILEELRRSGGTSQALRSRLMAEAFEHTARYDRMIADYFAADRCATGAEPSVSTEDQPGPPPLPLSIELCLKQRNLLRYGENPHQLAALYDIEGPWTTGSRLAEARQLNGKELSFNNWLDVSAAWTIVGSLDEPACVVIKHNNPCGAAVAGEKKLVDAVAAAIEGDPVSAFGSIIAVNRELDSEVAAFLAEGDFFIECLIAPRFQSAAVEILTTKPKWKKNVRLLESPLSRNSDRTLEFRQIQGGMLVQAADALATVSSSWQAMTDPAPDAATMADLEFAWNIVRFVKSNAILLASGGAMCGVGAGQMSRVDSVRIAIEKAGSRAHGSVMASDAFFPFPDSVELAARAGVRAIVQPGGSLNDESVIAACREHGIAMMLTGRRHFLH